MDFDSELEAAIKRGQQRNEKRQSSARQAEMTAEQIRNRHNDFRLNLSDHIEAGMKKMANHFPGFDYETIYGERGWGGAISRNDIDRGKNGRAGSFFSRLEITVRPQNEYNVVNIAGKGTIRDKEIFNWNHYEGVTDAKQETFAQLIDKWMLEFAEQFAAR